MERYFTLASLKLKSVLFAIIIILSVTHIYAQCPVTADFTYTINCTTVTFTDISDTTGGVLLVSGNKYQIK